MKRLTTFLLLFSCSSFIWAQTTATCVEWIKDESPNTDFKAIYTFGADYISYDISQPAQEYNPIGLKFISSGKSTEQAVLDMSDYPQVSFTLKNTSSSTIEAQVYLEDINGITLKFDNTATVDGDLYQYMIGATMEGKYGTDYNYTGTTIKSIAPSETFDFEYNFSNATAVDYISNPDSEFGCDNLPVYQCGDPETGNGDCFDYTQVTAVYITIINNDGGQYSRPEQCYTKEEFDGTVKISDIKIYGNYGSDAPLPYFFNYWEECDKVLSNESAELENNNVSFYPNPATDNVNFAKRLTNVEVYNAQGSLVETLGSANALNVASYEAGVYFIKATEGTSRVVVK